MSNAALEQPLAIPRHTLPAGRRVGDRRRELPTPGRSLVVDHGCDVRIGHVRLEPSVVLALLEWLPLMPADIAFAGRDGSADPVAALGDLLRPPTIWSPVEALAARGRDPASFERYAVERVTSLQISRLLRAAGRIAAQLPLRGLPCESAVVASGCAAVEAGEAVCAEVAARQLVRYATSELIRRL